MGIFKCDYDEHNYTTDDISEWRKHLQELDHKYVGNTECEQCGVNVKFSKVAKIKPSRAAPLILCEGCQT